MAVKDNFGKFVDLQAVGGSFVNLNKLCFVMYKAMSLAKWFLGSCWETIVDTLDKLFGTRDCKFLLRIN